MISSLLINSFSEDDSVYIIANDKIKVSSKLNNVVVIKSSSNLFVRLFIRFFVELFYIPFIAVRYQASSLLAFGNFNFIPYPVNKRILIHHPYLVDDEAMYKLPLISRIAEKAKRACFNFQRIVFRKNQYIAQTKDFKTKLEAKYNLKNVTLIPNPVTDKINFPSEDNFKIELVRRLATLEQPQLLYVSRYYPHKNHKFLLELAKKIEEANLNIKIKITVDTFTLPEKMRKEIGGSRVLVNMGEVDQEVLSSAYLESHLCIFPSLTETFGNGLIEAAKFGLPVIAFDFPYVKDVLEGNVTYIDSVQSSFDVILSFVEKPETYEKKANEIYQYSSSFLDVNTWKNLLIR